MTLRKSNAFYHQDATRGGVELLYQHARASSKKARYAAFYAGQPRRRLQWLYSQGHPCIYIRRRTEKINAFAGVRLMLHDDFRRDADIVPHYIIITRLTFIASTSIAALSSSADFCVDSLELHHGINNDQCQL
jgi:hypothetical protein